MGGYPKMAKLPPSLAEGNPAELCNVGDSEPQHSAVWQWHSSPVLRMASQSQGVPRQGTVLW